MQFVSVKMGNFNDRYVFLALPVVKEKVREIEKEFWSHFPSGWSFDHPQFKEALREEGLTLSPVSLEFGKKNWQVIHLHYGEVAFFGDIQAVVESVQAHILGLEAMDAAKLPRTLVRRPEGVPQVWVD